MNSLAGAFRHYRFLLPLCAGVFIAADDQTVIVTILPDVMASLRVGAAQLDTASWAVTGYLIGYTAAMPFMGRVSDRYGYRAAFIGALMVFIVGSALVALSPALPRLLYGGQPQFNWLVAARVFQAIGGGAVIPVAIAAASVMIEPSRRVVAYGLIGASAEAGGVIGPLWGGMATEWLSWEWAFWLNIPLAAAVMAIVLRMPAGRTSRQSVDYLGAALFAGGLTTLTLTLMRIDNPDWLAALLGITTIGLAGSLVLRSRSSASSVIPAALLTVPQLRMANLTHFLVGAALIVGMVTVPLLAATVHDATPLEGGLRLLRMTIAIGVGAFAGGLATRRFGGRWPVLAGLLLAAAGFWLMRGWGLETGDPQLTLHLVIAGLGLGLVVAPIAEAAVSPAPEQDRGAASAWLTSSRMVGMIVGLAAMASLGTLQFRDLVSGLPAFSLDPAVQDEILQETARAGLIVFRRFFTASAITCLIALLPAFLMTRSRPAGV